MSNSHTTERAMPKKDGAPLPNCFARQADDFTGTMRWVIVIRWRQFHCGSSVKHLTAETKAARKEVAEYIRAFRRENRPDLICRADLAILLHASGLDEHGRGEAYRSHYVTSDGQDAWNRCARMVAVGLMRKGEASALTGGPDVFLVTRVGVDAARRNAPPPPKLTRGQKRYREFLAADCSEPFAEFLRRRWYTTY